MASDRSMCVKGDSVPPPPCRERQCRAGSGGNVCVSASVICELCVRAPLRRETGASAWRDMGHS